MQLNWRIAVFIVPVAASGCPGPTPDPCPNRDIFCDLQPAGICLPVTPTESYCAYPAKDCASMWRWSVFAADSLREECVDPAILQQRDAGTDAAPPDAAGD